MGEVEHVDGLVALGRDEDEVDLAAVGRDDTADAMEESRGVLRHGRSR